jgi:hypothetical protein
MPTSTKPELVPTVPDIPNKRREPVVVSRSRRPKLGGKVTSVTLHPDGRYTVSGDGIKDAEFTQFAPAIAYARTGKEDQS